MMPTRLPYKRHRTYLTNHMGSISHHIMPLVINSLGADTRTHMHTCRHTHTQTHTQTYTHIHTHKHTQIQIFTDKAILRNQAST